MRLPDFWTGLAFAAVGLTVVFMSSGLHVPAGAASPRLFPTIIGGLMALMGVGVALRGLRCALNFSAFDLALGGRRLGLMVWTPMAIVLFALLAPQFGTVIVAVPLVTIHGFVYGLAPRHALGLGMVAGILIPLVFTTLMGISLPAGIVEDLLR